MPDTNSDPTDLPIKAFKSSKAWRDWLEKNHATSSGVWLKIAKKASGVVSVSYSEALEVALCQGWIDGQKRACDDATWLQRFTPRGPRSLWSKKNRVTAEALIRDGRMRPAGQQAIERARKTGRWDGAYEPASMTTVPDDLRAAMEANPKARAFFATLTGSNRYAILYRVQTAKRPETRAKRIAQFVQMLAAGEKIHP